MLHDPPPSFSEHNFTGFRKLFPLVVHLQLKLPEQVTCTFAPLWETWPSLRSLWIECEDGFPYRQLNLDSLLTGIRESSLPTLTRVLSKCQPVTLDMVRKLLSIYKSSVGISDLKHLRKFTLIRGEGVEELTLAGFFGFAMASPTLQNINIWPSSTQSKASNPFPDRAVISPECIQLIQSALGPLATLDIK
jgi:hypothetical protein